MTHTTSKKRNALDIQAEGLNVLNQYALELVNHFIPLLQPLVGSKIKLADGSRSNKFSSLVDRYEKENIKTDNEGIKKFISFQYWFDMSYSLRMHVKICINGGSYDDNSYYCEYIEKSIHLGDIDGQILKCLDTAEKITTSYNLTETFDAYTLYELVENFEQLKTKTREAYSKIPSSVIKAKFLSL